VVKLHEMSLNKKIGGYAGTDSEKRSVLRRRWKMPRELSITGPGSEPDHGEELGDE